MIDSHSKSGAHNWDSTVIDKWRQFLFQQESQVGESYSGEDLAETKRELTRVISLVEPVETDLVLA